MLKRYAPRGPMAARSPAILFRVPGEPIDVPLLWDRYTWRNKASAGQGVRLEAARGVVGEMLAALVMVALGTRAHYGRVKPIQN